jgi:DNA-binding response OmpR family regulator
MPPQGRIRRELAVPSAAVSFVEKPVIVIIDDNIATCTGLAELMELDGFVAYPTFSGREGLYRVSALRPDAVLLDMNMPDMSGMEVCAAIRKRKDVANTAIVFHSGEQKPAELCGADAFLTYPVPLDILGAVLRATIKKRGVQVAEPRRELTGFSS